jgi:putative transposase
MRLRCCAGCWACPGRGTMPDLRRQIEQIHTRWHGIYGSPRIHMELREAGIRCGRKRVARLMREAGLTGCRRPARRPRTTVADRAAVPAPDRLERQCTASRPNQVWVSDITYVPTGEDWRGPSG